MGIHDDPEGFNEFLKTLPTQPGVYRMYSRDGDLLYIGKAKSLRNRVKSYFQKNGQHSPKVQVLMQQVDHLDFVLTDSEIEALILESNLVKKNKPKYNILLKDDKKFPWIGLSDEDYPRLFITRTPSKHGKTKYFGPYTSSADLYATLQEVRKNFPLRQRRKPMFQSRPCMNYYIGTCMGPCQKLITPQDYSAIVRQVEMFLNGKAEELLELIDKDMNKASEEMNFERAAKLRDRYQAVEKVVERQKVFTDDVTVNQDVIACFSDELRCSVIVLNVRRGKLIGSRSHEIPLLMETTEQEAYSSFVYHFYQDDPVQDGRINEAGLDLPDEVILQYPIEDEEILESWLNHSDAKTRRKKVRLVHPLQGTKRELLMLAQKNAKEALEQSKRYTFNKMGHDPTRALIELQEALELSEFPARMECYDISHVQGSHTVASMVVFTDGKPDKQSYRRFKIKCAEGKPDDFLSMAEVIRRRFSHGPEEAGWDDPDLVIIDGGKGQLGAAVDALHELGITNQPIISLAKKFEEVFLPNRIRPVLLSRESPALFLLQQIRDEAHRFAITYHRSLRSKAGIKSSLDEVKGIGDKRKKQLLDYFGTAAKIREATAPELGQAMGLSLKMAEKLYESLHQPEVAE